jgi:hypothetical protein
MIRTRNLSQILAREPNPVEIRVEGYLHPVKDGEIIERIHGWKKVLKQLREIERRRSKNKVDSQNFRMDAKRESKAH